VDGVIVSRNTHKVVVRKWVANGYFLCTKRRRLFLHSKPILYLYLYVYRLYADYRYFWWKTQNDIGRKCHIVTYIAHTTTQYISITLKPVHFYDMYSHKDVREICFFGKFSSVSVHKIICVEMLSVKGVRITS
jgi:hypothetical protein